MTPGFVCIPAIKFMYTYLPAVNTDHNDKRDKSIRQLIKKIKLNCLTHFTHMDNLKSILRFGILPASILCRNKTFENITRHNGKLPPEWESFVSLNISFPDYKLFSDLNNHMPSDWVILLIDPKALTDFPCYFFPHRALDIINNAPMPRLFLPEFQKYSDFKALFSDREDIKRSDLNIPAFYTTDPTSEVLSAFPIGPSYITHVYFHSDYKFNQWVLHNTEFAMTQDRNRWAVGLEYFSPRSDYPFWKTRR